jgi:putative hemolysin
VLPPNRKLCENGDLSVWLGSAAELPHVLREIGRLREIAFRGAGEGTGHSRDLDRFDPHYLHLFLWNEATREVAGAYRLAATPDILPWLGPAGLYTSTLFRFDPRFFERLGPAIELGRSFVRPEYQKQYAPLLLLWKGIGRYAASRPKCAMLFGAASISDAYRPESRDLIVRMLQQHTIEELAPLVFPRNPYCAPAVRVPTEWDQLSKVIADLESDGKGVPILIKQYMRSGGKVLGFNVDRAFSNSLDALVVVNLREAAPALKARLQNAALTATCS